MLRTFLAVKIPATPELQGVLTSLGALGKALKAVASENLHVTLKFLGETPEDQVAPLGQRLQDAAESEPCFTLRLTGLGAFPTVRRPSVVWTGLQGADPLLRLSTALNESLAELGFEPETRPFQPHLTLARIKAHPPKELTELLQEHAATEFGMVEISSVEFIQSELRPEGPRYTVLRSAALRAG